MAETKEVKKRAPRKPKTATEKAPLEVNEIKEIAETPVVEEEIAPEVAEVEEEVAEVTEIEKEKVGELAEQPEVTEPEEEVVETPAIPEEGTELPEDTTPFEEFEAPKENAPKEEEIAPEVAETEEEAVAPSSKVAAKIKKLNPYLEDFQSKWIAILEVNGLTHKLFKGSYAKAINAAENYNISHGIGKGQVIKIRK